MAVVRLVALDPGFRGVGMGAGVLRMAEDLARSAGAGALCVNAQPGVAGFYVGRGLRAAAMGGLHRLSARHPHGQGARGPDRGTREDGPRSSRA